MHGKNAEKWMGKLWSQFIKRLAKIDSEEEMNRVLEGFVSNHEKKAILKRMAILTLVESGRSYQEISEILWLSPNSVSTVKKNFLTNENTGGYKSYLYFYKGPKQSGRLNKKLIKTQNEILWEIIEIAGKILKPFLDKGLGVTGEKYYYHK